MDTLTTRRSNTTMRAAAAPVRRPVRADGSTGTSRASAPSHTEEAEARRIAVLVALAESYFHIPDDARAATSPPSASAASTSASLAPDVASATLYATLAVALDEMSVDARRVLALCYLMGGASLLFPFAPSSFGDTRTNGYQALKPSRSCALAAIHVLQHGPRATFSDMGSARVYASACMALGRFKEAQEALSFTVEHGTKRKRATATPVLPERAMYESQVYTQLGRMAMKQGRYSDAATHFRDAREKDPWNWSAWTALCDMGTSTTLLTSAMAPPTMMDANVSMPSASDASAKRSKAEPETSAAAAKPVRRVTPRAAALRSGMARTVPPPPRDTSVPPVPPMPTSRTLATARTNVTRVPSKDDTNAAKPSEARRGATSHAPPASRLARPALAKPESRTKGAAATAATTTSAPARPRTTPTTTTTRPAPTRADTPRTPLDDVRVWVAELGEAYRLVRMYDGQAAIEKLCGPAQRDRPHRRAFRCAAVDCLLGRALHDVTEYAEAEAHFARAREQEPYLMMHMDIYSLVLFQLHREVALSALAQDLVAMDPRAAVTHMAAGNTWSLQHQHDAAYQCFRQATLVAPECAYAYTLAGYEALELEQPARAVRLFRCARRCDRRHWNALAGLGQVYLRQGHAARACEAYAQAFLINRSNAVLLDLLGWSLEQTGDIDGALAVYQRAIAMQPKAAMTRLKKAQLLLKTVREAKQLGTPLPLREETQRRQAAHSELLRVCALAPAEPRVHLMLARSYMRLGGGRFATSAATPDERDASISEVREEAQLPHAFHTEIAHHLATAIDLDPRCVRDISALGDVPKLALPGMGGAAVAEDEDDEHDADLLPFDDEHAPSYASYEAAQQDIDVLDEDELDGYAWM